MPAPWPPSCVLCLVTDRRALSAAHGQQGDPIALLTAQVAAAIDAGVDLVHLRERDLEAGALRDLAGVCAERAAGSGTRVVVNDRLDVALAASASGVHLRGDSMTASRVRAVVPDGFLVGQSIRAAADAAAATGADYLVLGTIYATPSKAGGEAIVGPSELARAAAGTKVPVLAIGGVSEERLPELARTGAAGVAAIRLFLPEPGGGYAFPRRVRAWRLAFDTNRPIT